MWVFPQNINNKQISAVCNQITQLHPFVPIKLIPLVY